MKNMDIRVASSIYYSKNKNKLISDIKMAGFYHKTFIPFKSDIVVVGIRFI